MNPWLLGVTVWAMTLIAACTSTPKPLVVNTNAAPTGVQSAKETPVARDEQEEESDVVEDGVEGGVVGGVVGGTIGGVPSGTLSGVPTGIVGATIPDPADGVFPLGHPRLSERKCPHPPAPDYPKAARDASVEATIITKCIIETDGSMKCTLLKSHPMFEKTFEEYLRKARVTPMTTTDGKPARVQCTQVYRYKIQ